MPDNKLVVVRGGGDLATGVVQKFVRMGMRVVVLEAPYPTAIRRTVALCEAVYEGYAQVEELQCRLIDTPEHIATCHSRSEIPLLVDPEGTCIEALKPTCLVDAILAKRNLGTHMGMAPITIGLGPGFEAGVDVHAVVETMRGHDLGRLYLQGTARPNTGIPGEIAGQSDTRVVHAPESGQVRPVKNIGEVVHQGEPILLVGSSFCFAPFPGIVRGMIRPGLQVHQGMKIADVDPRVDVNYHTISDKARCVGAGALEGYQYITRMAGES